MISQTKIEKSIFLVSEILFSLILNELRNFKKPFELKEKREWASKIVHVYCEGMLSTEGVRPNSTNHTIHSLLEICIVE